MLGFPRSFRIPFLVAWALFPFPGQAAVKAVATLPDLAWAMRGIAAGVPGVEVESLLRGNEDPHFVDAVPDFILKASNADLLCSVGLELEVGWLPKVIERSGNAKVHEGGAGFCEFGRSVETLDKPSGPIDRSMGDVHPFGNPHFWLSPRHLGQGAKAARDAFRRVDPAHAADYDRNYGKLVAALAALESETKRKLAPYAKASFLEYHREFAYFFSAYGLNSLGSLEEKPGVPPSAGQIGKVALLAKEKSARAILASTNNPEKTVRRFSELSGVRAAILPTMSRPKASDAAEPKDYPALQARMAAKLVEALGAP